MKILVTGSCGYKGSVLVPRLLSEGHEIISIDNEWFGKKLPEHVNLIHYRVDIRSLPTNYLNGVDTIIHLANIANDPAVDLNPSLSWEVNVLATQQLAEKAIKSDVSHFIYASSGSVYGIKKEEKVTEDLELMPISIYNKTKMVAERVLLSYTDKMKIHCVRPATVCGISPRMRLDVAVNMLTYQALSRGEITVLGGKQIRPNIHVDDIACLYIHLIDNSKRIDNGCFNAGFENISIHEIAKLIASKVDCNILLKESNDPRSYKQDSKKILETGFVPKKSVSTAIDEIIKEYKNGSLIESESCYNVKWMKLKKLS